ncbi:hypothetical protein [uncultured Winogradskyella sp.]|uniref:hypothetical protein n=1 Tax=uncultured Winogradskyella sp. TaxID=395353 RepID=UPI002619C1AD|nr:hypothetical protein [uncultured Winogradskyella sp.]
MKLPYKISMRYRYLLLFMCFGFLGAQEESIDVIDKYEDYTTSPRETVYLHLNKSTYIKGESIGFTAYVLDKKDKRLSLLTTNLYVSIEDENKNIIKKKLIRVINGVASNIFTVDSLFNSGFYNIKAFTNWMRNFDEHNYYSESIRVIDPEAEKYIEKPIVDNTIDAQFLPESGHLLHGVLNKVGVVIKDSQGFGLPNTKGEVIGKDNDILTTFITNELGIGSFSLMADVSDNYKVKINHANEDFNFSIGHNIKKNGVILSVKRLKTKLFASVTTNPETLDVIKNKRYTLMIHNGSNYDVLDIYFTDNTVVTKVIEDNSIPSGINILTLFNENEIPVAERLFFNYEGIDIIKTNGVSASDYVDSLRVKLRFKAINPEAFNNISISVLPQETVSYNRHHNLLSQTMLQPYIKGRIENGSYYFDNIDDKKRFDLDNLLVTQGWSSYDWNNMFLPDEFPYSFEQGIELKANVNNQKYLNDIYLLHHSGSNPPQYKQTSDGNKSIIFDSTFPVDNTEIYISRINADDNLKPAQLYLRTFPNTIPRLETKNNPLLPKPEYNISENLRVSQPSNFAINKVQALDEVVVESSVDKEMVRARKLSNHTSSTMKVPSENDKLTFLYLEDYLRANRIGVALDSESGDVIFSNGRGPGGSVLGGGPMLVYFDGALLAGTSFLDKFPLANIDYVEIDRVGFGGGARGANGILRIYSTTKSMFSSVNKATAQSYKIPLTFSKNKRFYAPKYQYYNDDFFKGYGTIDWKPELAVDSQGNVTFKILKPQVPITLFIEGVANDGSFIFEEKTISLN